MNHIHHLRFPAMPSFLRSARLRIIAAAGVVALVVVNALPASGGTRRSGRRPRRRRLSRCARSRTPAIRVPRSPSSVTAGCRRSIGDRHRRRERATGHAGHAVRHRLAVQVADGARRPAARRRGCDRTRRSGRPLPAGFPDRLRAIRPRSRSARLSRRPAACRARPSTCHRRRRPSPTRSRRSRRSCRSARPGRATPIRTPTTSCSGRSSRRSPARTTRRPCRPSSSSRSG